MSCGYDEEASTCRVRGRRIPRPEKHHAPHTVERDILRICTRSACMTPTLATRVVHVAVRLCAVSSLVRHVSVMTSETLARAGTRGRPVVLEARAAQGRDMTGCGCPRCSHHRRTGAAQRKRTAEFQRSPLGALTQGPLMSALWTPGRAGASPGSLRHGPARPSQVRPHRPLLAACAEGREAMTRRRLCLESACSTRVGIHWPRVVRTARRPHPPKVHPTLVQ